MQKFEPFQKVIVRNMEGSVWSCDLYSHKDLSTERLHSVLSGSTYTDEDILPYAGNEHLLGTTDSPGPKWEPKPGELVAVRDVPDEEWKARVFLRRDSDNGIFECGSEMGLAITTRWKFCEPLRKHFNVPD